MKNRDVIIESLNLMKKEFDKRNFIYQHGVDLSNYDNHDTEAALKMLVAFSPFTKDDLEWWLYDLSEKKIMIKDDKNSEEITYDVSKAEDFLDLMDKINVEK